MSVDTPDVCISGGNENETELGPHNSWAHAMIMHGYDQDRCACCSSKLDGNYTFTAFDHHYARYCLECDLCDVVGCKRFVHKTQKCPVCHTALCEEHREERRCRCECLLCAKCGGYYERDSPTWKACHSCGATYCLECRFAMMGSRCEGCEKARVFGWPAGHRHLDNWQQAIKLKTEWGQRYHAEQEQKAGSSKDLFSWQDQAQAPWPSSSPTPTTTTTTTTTAAIVALDNRH
jgi:hypothetical protein